jgi:multiple sugar transport system permease protein
MTTVTQVLRKKLMLSWYRKRELEGYLFVLPWVIGILFLFLYPMLYSAYISFTDWRVTGISPWVGLLNYQRLFKDPLFYHSLKLTIRFTLITVPLQLLFGFSMAFLLNQKIKGLSIFRTIYYMPAVLSGPAIAIIWRWLFNTDFGIINHFLISIGIVDQPIPWLTSRDVVLWFYIIMSLWTVGYTVVLYLAGLQGIPTEYYEAAEVDGANGLQKLWYITIPQLSPVIFYTLLTTVVASFQVFTVAFIVSSGTGAPANGSLFYYLYLYQVGFSHGFLGYAAAMGWVLFAILTVVSIVIFRASGTLVFYEARQREEGV